MAKAKLTTRAISTTAVTSDNLAKGSQLTHNQLDSNFLNLRDATFGVVADDSATIQIGMDSNLYIQGGDNVTTSTDSAGVVTINATGGDSLGDLTAVGSTISSPSNAAITLDPSGTGTIELNATTNVNGDITTDKLSFADNTIKTTNSNANLELSANGTGDIILDQITVHDNTISTNVSNANLELDANGTGTIELLANVGSASIKSIRVGDSSTSAVVTNFKVGQGFTIGSNFGQTGAYRQYFSSGEVRDTLATNSQTYLLCNQSSSSGSFKIALPDAGPILSPSTDGDSATSQNFTINSQGNGNIVLDPAGTGDIVLDAITIHDNSISTNDSNANLELSANGTGDIILDQITVHDNTISTNASNANLELSGNGSGGVKIGGIHVASDNTISTDASDSTTLTITTNGSGNISLTAETISLNSSVHIGLGGDSAGGLIIEDNTIKTARSNENIELVPSGTGSVHVQTSAIIDQVTITDNTISSNASNANLEINANGSGTVVLENLSVAGDGATVTGILDEDAMGSNSAVKLATQQSIKAYVDANTGDTTGDITFVGSTIISPSNADLTLNPAGTGKVNINAVYTLPNADGSANQVLGTNGSGVLSFRDPTAINIDGGVADSDYTSVPTIDGGTA